MTADNITLKGEFELKKQIFLDNSVQLDSEKKLIKDDIFICFASGSKEHIGKLTYIKNNTKYYAGGFMGILRGENSNLLTKYLFDLLNLEKYRNIVRSTSTGSNINNLSNTIGDIKIPLPPVEIQQKIIFEVGVTNCFVFIINYSSKFLLCFLASPICSQQLYLFRDSQGNPTTKLYDDKNHNNPEKASSYILKNFWNEEITEINKNIAEHISIANLTEMLDFSLVEFNKTISLNPKKDITVESRWEMVKLESIVKIIRGVIYNKNEEIITPTSNIILTADNITLKGEFELKKQIFLDNSVQLDSEKKLIKDDIFICFASGSKEHIGKLTYIKNNTKYYAGGFMGILRGENSNLLTKYLFDLLNLEKYRNIVRSTSTGSNINNLSNTIGDYYHKFKFHLLGLYYQLSK